MNQCVSTVDLYCTWVRQKFVLIILCIKKERKKVEFINACISCLVVTEKKRKKNIKEQFLNIQCNSPTLQDHCSVLTTLTTITIQKKMDVTKKKKSSLVKNSFTCKHGESITGWQTPFFCLLRLFVTTISRAVIFSCIIYYYQLAKNTPSYYSR